jgi:hypothetical protein
MVVLRRTIGTALFVQIGESYNRRYSWWLGVDSLIRTWTHPSKRLIYEFKISSLMKYQKGGPASLFMAFTIW